MESGIPTEVRQFVAKYVRSLDQLEVLLLISALPDREWSVDEVYSVVRSNPSVVAERLEHFVHAGFLTRSGTQPPMYRFAPRSNELAAAVLAVSAAYKMSRHKIVEMIYSPEAEDPLLGFSEAFRFKRKE
jgi:hypothetical protein